MESREYMINALIQHKKKEQAKEFSNYIKEVKGMVTDKLREEYDFQINGVVKAIKKKMRAEEKIRRSTIETYKG